MSIETVLILAPSVLLFFSLPPVVFPSESFKLQFFLKYEHRRRQWQPTPVFFPGESHEEEPGGLQSMGLQELDTT